MLALIISYLISAELLKTFKYHREHNNFRAIVGSVQTPKH